MEGVPKNTDVLTAELKELRTNAHKKDMMGFYDRIAKLGSELRGKYPDCEEYELFHLLVGSTLREGHKPKYFDFPGEDSIEKFLREQ